MPWTRLVWLALGLLTAALGLGCTPQIGDKCTVSTNCSTTGDRLCDVTQPDGYCTKFNCEPGKCPEDSVCVNFGTELSPVDGCQASQGTSPYKRSFCMANCGSDGDCRAGYNCLAAEEFNAVLAEHSSGQKVCAVRPKPAPALATDAGAHPDAGVQHSNEVCIGSDAGPSAGGASASGGAGGGSGGSSGGSSSVGGSAGESGEGGASGEAGAGG